MEKGARYDLLLENLQVVFQAGFNYGLIHTTRAGAHHRVNVPTKTHVCRVCAPNVKCDGNERPARN